MSDTSLLWTPTEKDIAEANLTHYRHWLARRGVDLEDYAALLRWSVEHSEDFWESLWHYFELRYSLDWTAVLQEQKMPGARWFPGMRLNYAENIFSRCDDARPMLLYRDENQPLRALSWAEGREQTRRLAAVLKALGVQPGDRVVAYLPNTPEAVIALLAVSSLGAIWSSCPPDFGENSVLDRFTQIEPKVLLAVDGYYFGGKAFDRRAVISSMQDALPSLEHTLLLDNLGSGCAEFSKTSLWTQAVAEAGDAPLDFAQVPFDHPLWVLYSSGTTGLPKPIVQGHGGILLEHCKATVLHNDIKPGERFYWYSSTGWMMWNYLVGALLARATIVLYDGSPAYPDMHAQFALAEQAGINYFGTSAAFITACMNAGIEPAREHELGAIRALGSTGSPLSSDGFRWIYQHLKSDLALESLSGGTDLCTAFVGGARVLPIYLGEIQGASLGADVQAFDEQGQAVLNEVGELVICKPMPSMPLYFWNDPDMERYRESYFDMFPGIWRHGDWIQFNARGGCIIFGRSDSTINRQGIRMGTSEIYRVVESFDEVEDSLVIDLEFQGRESFMPLFLVLKAGSNLNDDLRSRIKAKLRKEVSPRHVPDDMVLIDAVPYTLSGKKMEVPVRKILLGMDSEQAANLGAMRNPGAIDFFRRYGIEIQERKPA